MRLAGQRAPARHRHRQLAARARREEHRGRLRVGLHLDADRREHLRDRGADLAVAGQAVLREAERDLEAVRIAGIGHQLLRRGDVVFALRQRLAVAEDRRRHELVHRLAEAFHRDLGERLAVDREIDRLAHARVEIGVLRQRRAVLGADLAGRRLLAHVHFEVEHVDGVDLGDRDLRIALERRHVGGRHARDQVELSGLELRDARGVVRDLLAHDPRPRLLAAPVAVEAVGDEVALRRP